MKTYKYSPEIQERAVRMVLEHPHEYSSQWAAINAIASKIGGIAETSGFIGPSAIKDG
jgi:transposase